MDPIGIIILAGIAENRVQRTIQEGIASPSNNNKY